MKPKKKCYHPPLAKTVYSAKEQEARDVAKHNRVLKRIKKEFKKMPYANLTPHESLAQKTIGKATMDRNRAERRRVKKLEAKKKCKKKN